MVGFYADGEANIFEYCYNIFCTFDLFVDCLHFPV